LRGVLPEIFKKAMAALQNDLDHVALRQIRHGFNRRETGVGTGNVRAQ
jgi:hypothetical protein